MTADPSAQLIAFIVVLWIVALLWVVGRREYVATADMDHTRPDGTVQRFQRGDVVPAHSIDRAGPQPRVRRRSLLVRALSGHDGRVSVSKAVLFGWTLVIAYALLTVLSAMILGDRGPLDAELVAYAVLLASPIAVAVVDARAVRRRPTSLAAVQYIGLNVLAMAYVVAAYVGRAEDGWPELPPVLILITTLSAIAYVADQLLTGPARPEIVDVQQWAGGERCTVVGRRLVLESDDEPMLPEIKVGERSAQVGRLRAQAATRQDHRGAWRTYAR
jgi:hypothetical protein